MSSYFSKNDDYLMTSDPKLNSYIVSNENIDFNHLYNNDGSLFLSFSSNSDVENDLFEYYISNLSKRKVFSNTTNNEFRSLIIPNCYNSPALFQSVIALAANDMVRTKPEHSQYYSTLSLKYKNEAINILHNVLDTQPQFINSESSELLNEIVITILMLCSLEISDKGNKIWLNHLKEGGMIFESLSYSKILSSGMLLFAYRYFTLRYILLLTTLNSSELEKFIASGLWPLIERFFNNDKVDYMLGCSPRLLYMIYKITMLRHQRPEMKAQEYMTAYRQLKTELNSLTQHLNNSDQNSTELGLCSRLYYEGTKIFFHSSLGIEDTDELLNSLYLTISVLNEFSGLSNNKALTLAPLWSLFISSTCALEFVNDSVRVSILDVFENLEKVWPQASLFQIRLAIETIWKVHDLEFASTDSTSDGLKVDWREILSVAGFKLALT